MSSSPEIVLPYPISTNRMWVVSLVAARRSRDDARDDLPT